MWGKDSYDMMSPVPMRAPSRPAPVPEDPATSPPQTVFGNVVELVSPRGRNTGRIFAVVVAVGGAVLGAMAWAIFTFLEGILSVWGSSSRSGFPLMFGAGIALVSFGFAAYFWTRVERGKAQMIVNSDHMLIDLPEWRQPLMVPRSVVRLVAIDDRPTVLFRNNERFPIDGTLPSEVFADALDRENGNPFDPKPSLPAGTVAAPPLPQTPLPQDLPPSDPAEADAGWATVGSRVPPPSPGKTGHLYSAHGSALPLFLYDERDVPNVAVVFTGDVSFPRRSREYSFMGGRRAVHASRARNGRGLMVRARNGVQARAVFEPWNVVRNPRADDVLGAGLRPPKPLAGWRFWAYLAMFAMPIILELIRRSA